MGLFSVNNFARNILTESKILNMKNMKKFITWWTGVNMDRSSVLNIHVESSYEEFNRVLL